MRVLMLLSAYKQAKFEWILRKILKLETQNVIHVFIEIYVQFYYAHMWLQMTMSAHKIILWITQMWSQTPTIKTQLHMQIKITHNMLMLLNRK
jgi:hypothetical protein